MYFLKKYVKYYKKKLGLAKKKNIKRAIYFGIIDICHTFVTIKPDYI